MVAAAAFLACLMQKTAAAEETKLLCDFEQDSDLKFFDAAGASLSDLSCHERQEEQVLDHLLLLEVHSAGDWHEEEGPWFESHGREW